MQPTRSRAPAALALLLLTLQLGVVGVVPVAHGRAELQALSTETHVESEGRPDCPTGHNPVTCQLCQIGGPKFTAQRQVVPALFGGLRLAPPSARFDAPQAAALPFHALARAPPLA